MQAISIFFPADAGGSGLYLQRNGFDCDLFIDRADAQRDIDGGISIDL